MSMPHQLLQIGRHLRVELIDGEPMLWIPAESQKSNKDELLVIAPEFAELLLAIPEAKLTGNVFRTLTVRGETRRIDIVRKFIGRFGESTNIKVSVGKRAGKEHVKFGIAHDLRRAFGTRWAALVTGAMYRR